jgi:PAS domain S-box-containing protein
MTQAFQPADDTNTASFRGDGPAAATSEVLGDRRELALVAVERTRMPMVITDPREPDNPIVLANQAFLELTGYSAAEVLGRNCRFLQGADTDPEDIASVRRAMCARDDHVEIEMLNYRKDGSTFWNQLCVSAVHGPDGELLYYFGSQKDVTARREAQNLEHVERRLLKEIDHRAMNALALVQSIVSLTRTDSIARFAFTVKGRVDAIARAHRLLADSSWSAADLQSVICLEPDARAVERSGPSVQLAARLVQPLSLVFHELFANAREHGALRNSEGLAALDWDVAPEDLVLTWTETGVALDPSHGREIGLGLSLVRVTVEGQLGGTMDLWWNSDGIRLQLSVPWVR